MNIEAAHPWEAADFVRLQLWGVDVPSCPVFVEISKWSGDMVVVFLEPCPSLCP